MENISQIVGKFAKACKLKSIGVFCSSETPIVHHLQQHNKPISNEAPLSANNDDESIKEVRICDPVEPVAKEGSGDDDGLELELLKNIFDAVSALKLAYIELQKAHIPYDPMKIVAADDLVVAEIEKLSKFKREYKARQCRKARFNASLSDQLQAEIEAKETFLGKLRSMISDRDSEILRLRRKLDGLEIGNERLAEKTKRVSMEQRKQERVLSVDKFKDVFNAASKSIHDFAKPLITLLKASGWDLDEAAESIENGVVYSKRSDKKYAFEAYIARRMFHAIALASYDVSDVMKFDDPIDALMEDPDSDFGKFCRAKYLLVIHPKMEESFFGNLDHRTFVMSGRHPRTEFYQIFAKMAKWIWVLQGSAVSIDPDAALFSVDRGSNFSSLHMESVEEENESSILSDEERATYKVQFMIMPGFKLGQTLVKPRVYVSKHP